MATEGNVLKEKLKRSGLTKTEVIVAETVSRGLSNQQAADVLFVTEKTVKFHLTNVYRKLNLRSRSQLILWATPHFSLVERREEKPKKKEMAPLLPTGSRPLTPF